MIHRKILCFGDSNTHGSRAAEQWGERRRFRPDTRWPGVMAAKLAEGWRVLEEGHPGRTTVFDDPVEGAHKNGLRALPVLLETHRPIDLVIVMLGTNDQKARFGMPALDIALALERLALEILRSDCGPSGMAPQVLLAAPVPVEETGVYAQVFAGAAAKSARLAGHLEAVAGRLGTGFVDLAGVAKVDATDGVHLDEAAHKAIGLAMAATVLKLIDATGG